jgi:hypothetical protein
METAAHDFALLTPNQLARQSGIGAARIRRAIRCGELKALTAGSAWLRVRLADFDSWLESTRYKPPAPTAVSASDADDWARAKVAEENQNRAP